VAALTGALAWQVYAIWPYTPLHEPEAKVLTGCEPESRLSLLVANVLIENKDSAPLLALVDGVRPDLVLLVETDSWWDRQLEPLKHAFPHVMSHPLENAYGIHLFSRSNWSGRSCASWSRRMCLRSRLASACHPVLVTFYGLHPKPPPLQDTEERDAELLIVGKEVREEASPLPDVLTKLLWLANEWPTFSLQTLLDENS
jgi:endonuclease/exonuclease/phosphatase (EEP) superfamily protein YafD